MRYPGSGLLEPIPSLAPHREGELPCGLHVAREERARLLADPQKPTQIQPVRPGGDIRLASRKEGDGGAGAEDHRAIPASGSGRIGGSGAPDEVPHLLLTPSAQAEDDPIGTYFPDPFLQDSIVEILVRLVERGEIVVLLPGFKTLRFEKAPDT